MVGSTAVSPNWNSSPQRLVFHVAADQVALNGGTMLSIAGPPKEIQQVRAMNLLNTDSVLTIFHIWK